MSDIARKKDTGEPGNRGEFGQAQKPDSGLSLTTDQPAQAAGRFTLDSDPDRTFDAVRFGEPWNGAATPVVAREVFEQLLTSSGEPHEWRGDVAWLGTPAIEAQEGAEVEFYDPIHPSDDGTYDLAQLGWTLNQTHLDSNDTGDEDGLSLEDATDPWAERPLDARLSGPEGGHRGSGTGADDQPAQAVDLDRLEATADRAVARLAARDKRARTTSDPNEQLAFLRTGDTEQREALMKNPNLTVEVIAEYVESTRFNPAYIDQLKATWKNLTPELEAKIRPW